MRTTIINWWFVDFGTQSKICFIPLKTKARSLLSKTGFVLVLSTKGRQRTLRSAHSRGYKLSGSGRGTRVGDKLYRETFFLRSSDGAPNKPGSGRNRVQQRLATRHDRPLGIGAEILPRRHETVFVDPIPGLRAARFGSHHGGRGDSD